MSVHVPFILCHYLQPDVLFLKAKQIGLHTYISLHLAWVTGTQHSSPCSGHPGMHSRNKLLAESNAEDYKVADKNRKAVDESL